MEADAVHQHITPFIYYIFNKMFYWIEQQGHHMFVLFSYRGFIYIRENPAGLGERRTLFH